MRCHWDSFAACRERTTVAGTRSGQRRMTDQPTRIPSQHMGAGMITTGIFGIVPFRPVIFAPASTVPLPL